MEHQIQSNTPTQGQVTLQVIAANTQLDMLEKSVDAIEERLTYILSPIHYEDGDVRIAHDVVAVKESSLVPLAIEIKNITTRIEKISQHVDRLRIGVEL